MTLLMTLTWQTLMVKVNLVLLANVRKNSDPEVVI